jgi:Domain of unknown function (DUF4157)
MKPNTFLRYRRRRLQAKPETSSPRKADAEPFFGEHSSQMFFQPAVNVTPHAQIQRDVKDKEKEDPAIPIPGAKGKEEEKEKVMRAADENEDEKIQRRAKKEIEEEEKVQRKNSGPAILPGNNVTKNYIHSLNGKGKTLPTHAQYFFAARMGYDFSNVKVHTDGEATRSAQEVNAKAYTVGSNIVFNEGQCDVESSEGKKLMAHELTHVMQQNKGITKKIECPPATYKPAE